MLGSYQSVTLEVSMRRWMQRGSAVRIGSVLALTTLLAGCAGVLDPGSEGDETPPSAGASASAEPDATVAPSEESPEVDGEATDDGVQDPEDTPTDAPTPDSTEPSAAATEPDDDRGEVTVVPATTLASANVISVGGYVQDVIELGGTCHYTLTQGGDVVTGESEAEPDATTTWCANVDLTLPHPGQRWELELRYESPMSVGTGELTSGGDVS